ncbi:MAG TPA: acetaldehyde dehydrogenase [Anaerolineaceae bacterium]|nr:acetaldehyde dehydrogenase [Anaerolineaceae bacterium]
MQVDKDLLSIQEARDLAAQAYEAQLMWGKASQEQVDRVCEAMAEAGYQAADRLGRMANEETGFGIAAHKKLKNELASRVLWESIRDVKTVGVIKHDVEKRVYEIAWPMGVVAALTPSTNPTSTVMAKAISAVKARDAIVVAPHPSAVNCSFETARTLQQAAENAGAPAGLINCMRTISLAGTQELMTHKRIRVILATGGGGMVKAAHSVGKPAYGVGPGNVPAYVDRSADLEKAARYIVSSKSFDYSLICASEQAVVADKPIAARLAQLMKANGAYFADEKTASILRHLLFNPDGSMNVATVGKSPQFLAQLGGFDIPAEARVIVVRLNRVGAEEPLSREKLTTVLGWYEEEGWEKGCERCIDLIHFGGRGHSLVLHATDQDVIMAFGLEKPVFRILVNTMSALGAVGLTTGVMPSLTLGAGGEGGSVTGDNITVHHLFNIKRLAYEITPPPDAAMVGSAKSVAPTQHELESIVKQVMLEVLAQN